MARGRVIRPDFWTDENVLGLSAWARLFYVGLWNFAYCDKGHLPDESFGLKLKILPNDPVDHKEIMGELLDSGRVERVDIAGTSFLVMPSFEKHQTEDKRWKSRCPACTLANSEQLHETQRSFAEHIETPPNSALRGEERKEPERTEEEKPSSSEVAVAPIRPDVLMLIERLDMRIKENGGKAPSRTDKNLNAARLLLDRDGIKVEQAIAAIDWATGDEFWRTNILSMSKLRDKYEQLRLAATRVPRKQGTAPVAKADQNAALFYELYGDDYERTRSIPAIDAG